MLTEYSLYHMQKLKQENKAMWAILVQLLDTEEVEVFGTSYKALWRDLSHERKLTKSIKSFSRNSTRKG